MEFKEIKHLFEDDGLEELLNDIKNLDTTTSFITINIYIGGDINVQSK